VLELCNISIIIIFLLINSLVLLIKKKKKSALTKFYGLGRKTFFNKPLIYFLTPKGKKSNPRGKEIHQKEITFIRRGGGTAAAMQ